MGHSTLALFWFLREDIVKQLPFQIAQSFKTSSHILTLIHSFALRNKLPHFGISGIGSMQYVENSGIVRRSRAVRGRIDWKYALSLELTDKGFDAFGEKLRIGVD